MVAADARISRAGSRACRNDNAQREYYLTDVIAAAVREGVPVRAVQPGHAWETLGVNSKAQLAELERVLPAATSPARCSNAGVTLADPARIDVRGELECGRDVRDRRQLRVRGRGRPRRPRVASARTACSATSRIGADTRIEPFCHLEEADIGAQLPHRALRAPAPGRAARAKTCTSATSSR